METALKMDVYEEMAPVFSGTTNREFVADCIVPDTMPDVASIVDAEAVLTLRSKETEAESIGLTASVSVSVLYVPENGGKMRSVPITLPVDIRLDAPNVDAECRTIARLRVKSVDAWAENSRKLNVRADVEAQVTSYKRQNISIASGMEQDEQSPVHMLVRDAEMIRVSDVKEKTFVVTDEYQLPPGFETMEGIVSKRVSACVDDVKYASGKVVFRGRALVSLLYEGSGETPFFSGQYESEFSQIMEVASAGSDVLPEVSLMLTGAYFDLPDHRQGEAKISAELHFAAQSICRERQTFSFVADLYSNQTKLIPEQKSFEFIGSVTPVSMRQTVTGRAEPFAGEDKVIGISANVGTISRDGLTVKTTANLRLVCAKADGQYYLSRSRLSAEFTTDLPVGTELCDVSVSATDVYYTATGGGTDVRVTLQMNASAVTHQTVDCVCGVTQDANGWETEKNVPSVTLVRVGDATDLWTVARTYHSTVEAIEEANTGKAAGLLLIPRAR